MALFIVDLEDHAVIIRLFVFGPVQADMDGTIEDVPEAVLGERGALAVLSVDLAGEGEGLVFLDHLKALAGELADDDGVATEVGFGAHEDEGDALGVLAELAHPFLLDVGLSENRSMLGCYDE